MCYYSYMLKIVGNDIWRSGTKIGYIQAERIYNYEGRKVGYFTSNDIYTADGHKRGYLRGNLLEIVGDGTTVELDNIREKIGGGSISDIARATIFLVLGD